MQPHEQFIEMLSKIKEPSVLELGVCRSIPDRCTMHKDWAPHAKEFIGSDYIDGLDVDVVCDAHFLSETFGAERFDALIACSVFEHLQYPTIVVPEMNRILKPSGLVFVQTHNAYPIHAYPFDYWRYTTESLISLFSKQAGFECIEAYYDFPASIVSVRDSATKDSPAYLNVSIFARKTGSIPGDFVYRPQKYFIKRENQKENGVLKTEENVKKAAQEWLLTLAETEGTRRNALKFKRLRKHWLFGPIVRLADHIVNSDLKQKQD